MLGGSCSEAAQEVGPPFSVTRSGAMLGGAEAAQEVGPPFSVPRSGVVPGGGGCARRSAKRLS